MSAKVGESGSRVQGRTSQPSRRIVTFVTSAGCCGFVSIHLAVSLPQWRRPIRRSGNDAPAGSTDSCCYGCDLGSCQRHTTSGCAAHTALRSLYSERLPAVLRRRLGRPALALSGSGLLWKASSRLRDGMWTYGLAVPARPIIALRRRVACGETIYQSSRYACFASGPIGVTCPDWQCRRPVYIW